MHQRKYFVLIGLSTMLLFLSACGTSTGSGAVKSVEDYLNALVAKNTERVASISCADWESSAIREVDSFQAVKIRMEGLACKETGNEAGTTLVVCQGKIIATYNNEDQELDLSVRTYQVVQEGGEYLVCGYR
jgi:hypothetical protein